MNRFLQVPNPPDEAEATPACFTSTDSALPLPKGEGRGEGEHGARSAKAHTNPAPLPRIGTNIIQLRQLLKEKFPGLRTKVEEFTADTRNFWPTGLRKIDDLLQGGLAKGALTEMVAERFGTGSALLAGSLLRQAAHAGQIVAFVDGADSLEVMHLEETALSRLLWVRCRSAAEALKAADLLLRDGNVPLVLIDLAGNQAQQLRKIPATTWYRLQRLIEETATVCVVFTPRVMVSPAQNRIFLRSHFSLAALEQEQSELLCELKLEASEARLFGQLEARA